MPCPRCSDICSCSAQDSSIASSRWVGSSDAISAPEVSSPTLAVEAGCEPSSQLLGDAAVSSVTDECAPADSTAWRQEVAARLNRYQSRRKPRPPRYPSLLLRFDGDDAIRVSAPPPSFKQPSCDHALALDEYPLSRPDAGLEQRNLAETEAVPEPSALLREFEPADDFSDDAAVTRSAIGRIIQFPCSWTPPPAPVDQLAEPVMSRPRILEGPQNSFPLPRLLAASR